MTKFNSITAILTAIIFTLTGEAQDPITLRLAMSVISALMLSSIYCAFTEESRSTKTIALLTGALIAATIADPDPSTIQVLMAFVVAPIIASIAIMKEQEKKDGPKTLVEPNKSPESNAD